MPGGPRARPSELPPLSPAVFEALDCSAAAAADLERFAMRLGEANARMNLIGLSTIPDFWARHVIDSAQLLIAAPHAKVWADIGSGAGFPGLVLSIMLKESPGAKVHLIESGRRKAGFLSAVVDALGLPAEVHPVRAETLSFPVQVVTARACAPLVGLLGHSWGFLRTGARGLFLKGEGYEVEVAEARRGWRFTCEAIPSRTDPRGRILSVADVRHAV